MDKEQQKDLAQAFRRLHTKAEILLLPNAWDAGSAALFARQGFAAIATTSGGLAWSLGYADGEQAPLGEVLAAIARIVRAVSVPITVDLESGYGDTPQAVAETVRAVLATGVVGINLEDGLPGHGPLRSIEDAAARVAAARAAADAAGIALVINARVDCWMHSLPDPAAPLDEALARGRAYLAAGADGLFPIGLRDPDTLSRFAAAVAVPVNVAAGAGVPSLAELARLGVKRVSTATRLATVAYGAADEALRAVQETGQFDALGGRFTYQDAQQLFEA